MNRFEGGAVEAAQYQAGACYRPSRVAPCVTRVGRTSFANEVGSNNQK